MPGGGCRITAVIDRGAHGVEVHLDGRRWRTVPVECAAAARLAEGVELDRERARSLARALRARRGIDVALRALRHADHSRASLERRLAERGVTEEARVSAVAVLERAGLVDDARVAAGRAESLARRGLGDAAIRDDLGRRGFDELAIAAAVAELPPEAERAAAIVSARGGSVRTARLLCARGFDEDVVEAAIAAREDSGIG